MAKIKISNLPDASLPIGADTYLLVVKNDHTYKTTVSALFTDVEFGGAEGVPALAAQVSTLTLEVAALDDTVTSVASGFSAVVSQVSALTTNITVVSSNLATLQTTFTVVSALTTSHTTNINAISTTVSAISSVVTAHTTNINSISTTVAGVLTNITAVSTAVSALSSVVTAHTTNLNAISTTVSAISSVVTAHTTNLTVISTAVSALASVVTAHTTNLNAISTTVSTHTASLATLTTNLNVVSTAVSALTVNVSAQITRITSVSAITTNHEVRITNLESALADALLRITALEEGSDIAPGFVGALAAAATSSAGIQVTWDEPTTGTAPFTYNRRHRVVGVGSFTIVSAISTGTTITGLTAETAYEIGIQAMGSGGSGSWASTTATTLATGVGPGLTGAFTAASTDSDSILLTWSDPVTGDSPFTFNCRYRVSSGGSYTIVSAINSGNSITGLSQVTEYEIGVQAKNVAGFGSWNSILATTAENSATPPLDGFSTLVGGYSFRKLLTAYGGSAVRLARVDTGTEQDIGFADGHFDLAAAASFLTGTSGKVVRMYDQTGNSRHLVYGSATTAPDYIANSATLGRPIARFNTTDDRLATTASTITLASTSMLHLVGTSKASQSIFSRIVSLFPSGASADYNITDGGALLLLVGDGSNGMSGFYNGNEVGGHSGPVEQDARFIVNLLTNASTSTIYVDGSAAVSTVAIGPLGPGILTLGKSVGAGSQSFAGDVAELVISHTPSQASTLRVNATAYFEPAAPPISYTWAQLQDNINDGGASPFPMTYPVTGIGAPASTVVQWSLQFRQGDLPSGSRVVMKRSSTSTIVTQTNVTAQWNDGSARNATLFMADPGVTLDVVEYCTMTIATSSAGTDRVWSTIASSLSASIVLGSQTIDLFANVGATNIHNGPLAIARRGRVPITGMGSATGGELVYAITLTTDGNTRIDFNVANHGVFQSGIGTLIGNFTLTVNGTVQRSHTALTVAAYQGFMRTHRVKPDGSNAHEMLLMDPVTAYRARVGVVKNYDITNPPGSWADDFFNDIFADPNFDTPMHNRSLATDMGASGGRKDLGVITFAGQIHLMRGDRTALVASLAEAEAQASIPWHFRNLVKGSWANPIHNPNHRTFGADGTFTMSSAIGATGGVWGLDGGHHPDAAWVPYLMTGHILLRDEIEAWGMGPFMELGVSLERGVYDSYFTNTTDSGPGEAARRIEMRNTGTNARLGGNDEQLQVRGGAWVMRGLGRAAFVCPEAEQSGGTGLYIDLCMINMKQRLEERDAVVAIWGEIAGFEPYWTYGDSAMNAQGLFPPWQNDMRDQVLVEWARFGIGYTLDYLQFAVNWTAGRFLQTDFNAADGTQYNLVTQDDNVRRTHWSEITPLNPTYGANYAAVVTHTTGDYEGRARAIMNDLHDLFIDSDKPIAFEKVDAAKTFLEGIPAVKTYTDLASYTSAGDQFSNIIAARGETFS